MTVLLFPGRHLLHTAVQESYLRQVVQMPLAELSFAGSVPPPSGEPIGEIVFAITSSNQSFSRYNPVPFHVRVVGVDRFARSFAEALGISYRIAGVPHYAPTPKFASIILKEISEQTENELDLTPGNCVVLTSTPTLIDMFLRLGFAVLPAEADTDTHSPPTPQSLLARVVRDGTEWNRNMSIRADLSLATLSVWRDFPEVLRRVMRLHRDPLLSDSGGLTEGRDYQVYTRAMSNQEILDVKYADIRPGIVPGRIVDEGCADGALLERVARDFPDSDLIGIDIAGELIARALERQRSGAYADTFVHFHQRNLVEPIFADDSVQTTICNSTLHELWSYGEGQKTVMSYLHNKYRQLAPGGRLVVRDVVGPEEPDTLVYLWLNDSDGESGAEKHRRLREAAATQRPENGAHTLRALSTRARFFRFCRDFSPRSVDGPSQSAGVLFDEVAIEGRPYLRLRMIDAAEFLSKKDYVENWASEMREEFAFWDFTTWKRNVAEAGFLVLENPNAPHSASRVYTSEWIVRNRYQGKAELYQLADGRLRRLPYPPTNIVLIVEKPLQAPAG